jgi:hypothetical protein
VNPVTAQQLVRGAWPPDGDGREWALACRGDGTSREKAVARLRAFLVAIAWFEADRRRPQLRGLTPRETAALVCDAAEAALAAVVDRLSEYRGQSRFTTWAAKFAIHETALACRVANDGVRTGGQGATNELSAAGEAKERPERVGMIA